jgi:phage terminase large subunit-like protein
MIAWDRCVAGWEAPPADAPLYVGLDLAESDDLCAAIWVYPTPDKLYIDATFWLPRSTAEKYEREHSVPYAEWAAAGDIRLLDQPTIDPAARNLIAAEVLIRGQGRTVKAVGYDRYKADETVAAIESRGLTCVPIAQGYSLSPGSRELERRIKEGPASIGIKPNAVMRFCAENAGIKADDRGNIWPVKPGAKGKFAGTRWKKIDGIAALVTALVEARKHRFPAVKKAWKGTVQLV